MSNYFGKVIGSVGVGLLTLGLYTTLNGLYESVENKTENMQKVKLGSESGLAGLLLMAGFNLNNEKGKRRI